MTNPIQMIGGGLRRMMLSSSVAPEPECRNLIQLWNAKKGSYGTDGKWFDGVVSLSTQPVPIKAGETKIAVTLKNIQYGQSSRINFWKADGSHLSTTNFSGEVNVSGDVIVKQTINIPANAYSFTLSLNLTRPDGTQDKNTDPIRIRPQAEWGDTYTDFVPHPEDVKRGIYYIYEK